MSRAYKITIGKVRSLQNKLIICAMIAGSIHIYITLIVRGWVYFAVFEA